jgi:hypothetical protein
LAAKFRGGREGGSTVEDSLQLFCRRVAGLYIAYAALGKGASIVAVVPFLTLSSDTYFYRICDLVHHAARDEDVRRANEGHREQWRRVLSMRVVGSDPERLSRLITTLELQRLLIEFAFGEAWSSAPELEAAVPSLGPGPIAWPALLEFSHRSARGPAARLSDPQVRICLAG